MPSSRRGNFETRQLRDARNFETPCHFETHATSRRRATSRRTQLRDAAQLQDTHKTRNESEDDRDACASDEYSQASEKLRGTSCSASERTNADIGSQDGKNHEFVAKRTKSRPRSRKKGERATEGEIRDEIGISPDMHEQVVFATKQELLEQRIGRTSEGYERESELVENERLPMGERARRKSGSTWDAQPTN
ncbi:hypothetical protein C8R45DRAFT_942547 [Mycena sanguinolenta]|nr:hypothetical protein C8R45DRAFT_942547 [Mycena sanguinolenta]